MSLAKYYIKKIQQVDSELEEVGMKSIEENMDFIMYLLKEKQLGEGIKSDGSDAPNYSYWTQFYAKGNPPRTGVSSKEPSEKFNFEWSGEWIDSLYMKFANDGFDILARDSKTSILERMSGGKITALTEEHNRIINDDIVKPALWEHFVNNVVG